MAVVQLSLDDICRACLSRENLEPLAKSQRLETVQEFVDIQISLTDGMPSKICSDCWDQVAKWKLFKELFRKNDSTLRGLLLFSVPSGSQAPAVEPMDVALDEVEIVYEKEKDRGEEQECDLMQFVNELNFSVEEEREEAGEETQPTPSPPVTTRKTTAGRKSTRNQEQEPIPEVTEREPEEDPPSSAKKVKANDLICKHCDKKFRKLPMLEAHIREHEGKLPFQCKTCGKEFGGRLAFRNHNLTHSSEKYPCPSCDRTFNYPQLVDEHRKRMHTKQEKNFKCDVCSKDFARAQTLQVHMLTHTDEKPLQCDICQARFKSQSYLQIHRVRHSKVRNFECPEQDCQKSFYTKSELKFHTHNVHADVEKKFKCPDCGKGFTRKSALEVHKKSHTGDRKFKCTECPRSFNSLAILNSHTKTAHTPEVYECGHCQKQFRLKHSYETHLKSHDKE